MPDTAAPADDTAHRLIGEARDLATGLVAFLFNQLNTLPASSLGPRMLRTFLRTVIKPCEALIRRAIFLIAAGLPVRVRRVGAARRAPAAPPERQDVPPAPRIPAFRLTERAGPAHQGLAPPPRTSGSTPASAEQFNARFLMRLAALRAACADPEACARRLVRRLARQRPATRPLKPKPPTGITGARMDRIKTLFADLEAETARAWARFADSS